MKKGVKEKFFTQRKKITFVKCDLLNIMIDYIYDNMIMYNHKLKLDFYQSMKTAGKSMHKHKKQRKTKKQMYF